MSPFWFCRGTYLPKLWESYPTPLDAPSSSVSLTRDEWSERHRGIQCRVLTVRLSHWYFLETMQLIEWKFDDHEIFLIRLIISQYCVPKIAKRVDVSKFWKLRKAISLWPSIWSFAHLFRNTLSSCGICFQNCITLDLTKKTLLSLDRADF